MTTRVKRNSPTPEGLKPTEERPTDPKKHLQQIETEIALLSKRLAEKKREHSWLLRNRGVYLRVVCHNIPVFPDDGQDTCPDSITRIWRKTSLITMNIITQLEDDITRYEADAAFYEACAQRCRSEAALLREELENERAGKPQLLEEARTLAHAILRLDGLTGAEIEVAENALSDEPVNIQRLRQIAANHSTLTPEFL